MQGAVPRYRSVLGLSLRSCRYWLLSVATMLVLLLPMGSLEGHAQATYPPFLDSYLNDYGQVIEASDAVTIRTTLQQYQQQTGIQAVVVTINSVQDYRTGDPTIESFATNLFNTWGIGDRTRNDGILLLVAPGDRKVRLELGSGYASSYNAVAQTIIDDEILPYFRQDQISQGTVSGVNAIVSRFRSSTAPPATFRNPLTGDSVDMPPGSGTALIASLLSLAAGCPVVLYWQRHRKRQCSRCRIPMERLDEQTDDQFLHRGQLMEESLHSVDYDVWRCSSCGRHHVLGYSALFSSYRKCPRCSTKALEVRTATTREPTYTSTGEQRIDENCRNCFYEHTHYRTIPRRERHSSSSSGGGGGGRSSGGGASGSW